MINVDFYNLYRGAWGCSHRTLDTVVGMIRDGKYLRKVNSLREELCFRIADGMVPKPDNDSGFLGNEVGLPSVTLNAADRYAGLVQLTLPFGDDREALERLRSQVKSLPQVILAFEGSSGRTLKVVFRFALPDGTLPMEADEVRRFHAAAYLGAATFVMQLTGVKPIGHDGDVERGFRMTADEAVWYNPKAVAMPLEQPSEMPSSTSLEAPGYVVAEKNRLPGYDSVQMQVAKFAAVCRRLHFDEERKPDEFLMTLAGECYKAGIDEGLARNCVLAIPAYKGYELLVDECFTVAYETGKAFGSKDPLPSVVYTVQNLQHFLETNYAFRRNSITGSVEYVERKRFVTEWRPLNSLARNTIRLAALNAGISAWDRDLDRYVDSDKVHDYDPVQEWIYRLPEWDGRDRISELAATVPTDAKDWAKDLGTWLRSMVSQWMGRNTLHGSSIVLMLTGGQGYGKSSFFRRLLPEALQPYYNDHLDFSSNKEAERALMRFVLLCIDEFDQITASQTARLKHIIQKTDVKWRKMYQDDIEQKRRYAAFCATTNSASPLIDQTGSRRYLCIELSGPVDQHYELDHEQLFAQIVSEIRAGKPTYFSVSDEVRIQKANELFTEETPLKTLLLSTVCRGDGMKNSVFLTSLEILKLIINKHKVGIKADASAINKMGKLLGDLHFTKKRVTRGKVYLVSQI